MEPSSRSTETAFASAGSRSRMPHGFGGGGLGIWPGVRSGQGGGRSLPRRDQSRLRRPRGPFPSLPPRPVLGRRRLSRCARLIRGNRSGCSMDSIARSTSSSGQRRCPARGSRTLRSFPIGTSRNQGKCLKARNLSRPPIRTQKPCSETFVTSGSDVLGPGCSDLILVLPNKARQGPVRFEPPILREFDGRLQPCLHRPRRGRSGAADRSTALSAKR